MGWRDREWARWTTDERKRFYGATEAPRSIPTRVSGGRTWRRNPVLRAFNLVLIAVLATAGIMVAYVAGIRLPSPNREPAPAAGIARTPAAPTPTNVIDLRSRPGLDTRVTSVTQWWVDDPRIGRVSVYVPVGETPRQALTVALAQRDYQVVVDP
jgi:hypothetical protein